MVWATSVNMPAGATVGGKTEAQIGAEVQAALAAGDESKLESIMNSLHNAGYSGSFNASQEFKDVGVSDQSMGIVPASVAASPTKTAAYVEEHQMGPSRPTTPSIGTPDAGIPIFSQGQGGPPSPNHYWDETGGGWRLPQPDGSTPGAMPTIGGQDVIGQPVPYGANQQGQPNYLDYVLNNPGLRENAEAHGYTQQEMIDFGDWHWNKYGQGEFEEGGRLNTPYQTQLPGERTAPLPPAEAAAFEASVRRGDPSEMWSARAAIDPAWNVGQFSGQGWNVDPDNPYMRGILGDTIAVDAPVGQLMDTGDPRFLQDRYQDPYIAQDFPVGWTTPQNTWAGPEQLGGYWDALTNAERNAAGEIRSMVDRPAAGWAGPSVSPGMRGGGNIRAGGGGLPGPPNPAVPSFGFAGYQDWEPFMPTDFPLAAASGGRPAGWRYQPWVGAMGGGTAGQPGGGPGNIWGGATATGGPGAINPNIWGTPTAGGGNATTWPWGAGPEGAEGNDYDAEGYEIDRFTGKRTGAKINDPFGIGDKILGLMGAWPAQVQRDKAAWTGGLTANQIGAMNAANAAQAGTGFADMYGGGGTDPTAAGFVDWDE